MSPEQTRGRDIDRRSDFFSLGCLLYQCLTGVLPFKSENVLATLQSVQMLTPTAPTDLDPSVSSDLSSLVMTLLEKSPVNRPDQADDIAAAFDLPVSDWNFAPAKNRQAALPINSDPKTETASHPIRWWSTIAALVALGFLLVGGYFMPQIIRIATNQGQIVIESNDPDVQIEVLKDGELIEIVDLKTKQKLNIVAGEYQIRPMGNENEISIDKQSVTISRGSETIVRVTREQDFATAALVDDRSLVERFADTAGDEPTRSEPSHEITDSYLLDTGDILGVFIENVLGEFGSAPPIQYPAPGSDLPPAVGYPTVVMKDGTISLPLIPPVSVRGKSVEEVKIQVERAYRGGENPILIGQGRILVSLARKRGYQPPIVANASQSEQPELPTFNGMSYNENYKVVKYERNPELAWSSLLGLIELYDENTKEEAIQVCIEFLRRNESGTHESKVDFLRRFGAIVDADTCAAMLLSELHSGTQFSQRFLIDLVLGYTGELKRKAILSGGKVKFAKATVESANDLKLSPQNAAMLLLAIRSDTDLDISLIEGVDKTLLAAITGLTKFTRSSSDVIELAMEILPNSPEIIKAVCGLALNKSEDNPLARFVYEKLIELNPDQLKVCVPMIQEDVVYKKLKAMHGLGGVSIGLSYSQERVFDLIAAFGDHAKTKSLVSDFKVFETWEIHGEAYVRARETVLGK